jgi:O-acetyl-ADP-ribose deacetylase (regulator of RNase III)/uncharacterized protein YwgA
MISYITGDLLESEAEALVNTVNTVGVMGKGIALQFKKQFPHNTKVYQKACKDKTFDIGDILVVDDKTLLNGKKIIINFPTKKHWRNPSEYTYIEQGLEQLVKIITTHNIKSIAIPALGAGNGGLDWNRVKVLLVKFLEEIDCKIFIYEPNVEIKETLKKEHVKLTPARAMLLAVLYDLVRDGEFVSEFAAEKVCYFLQRFGATYIFKLDYNPNFYGPYSGKVRHVLYYLNGSYIMGYSRKDKKPFEPLSLLMSTEKEVNIFLSKDNLKKEKAIIENTKVFLKGFYSDFSLELLSTLDYIIQKEGTTDLIKIKDFLNNWSSRKSQQFGNNRFLELGLKKLETMETVNCELRII